MSAERERISCCIVGGGPAGAVLSLLLARNGVPVTLLEGHKDFDREFRGDTLHPSVMEIMDEIGLADALLALAAHVMSPVGGVGINDAIQDAAVAANVLSEALRNGRVMEADLARVQRERYWPTRFIQRFQAFILSFRAVSCTRYERRH